MVWEVQWGSCFENDKFLEKIPSSVGPSSEIHKMWFSSTIRLHVARIHTQSIIVKYQKKCELCEKKFGNSTEFKHHMKNSNNQNLSVKFAILWESYGRTYWQNPYWIFQMWSIWEEFWGFRKVRNSFKYFWNVRCKRCVRKETTTTNIINHA